MITQASAMPRLRVLIAEDDVTTRTRIAEIVEGLGHEVVAQADNGHDAVARARELQPDVALLDVQMPGMDGIEVAEVLHEAASDVAAVLLSGDLEVSLGMHDPGASNAVAVLPKPASPGILDATLRLAVCRMRERNAAQREAAEAQRRLDERKIIEKAKGILMKRVGGDEEEAYRILRRTSQDRARPMVEIARIVLQSEPGARAQPRA